MAVLGQDLSPIRDSVSGALATLRGATDAAGQASPSFSSVLRSVAQPQSSGLDAGLAPLYQVGYGAQAASGFGGNAWQTLAQAASAFGGGSGFGGLPGVNLDATQAWQGIGSFGNYLAAKAAAPDTRGTPLPGASPSSAPSGAPGTPGQGWGAPTAQQLDEELAGSPLAGQGATIAAIAAKHGVPVTVAMGILRQESSYGRNATGNNYGGLMNADGSHTLAQFGSVADGLDAVIGNMSTPIYRGKTIDQFMHTYAPPADGNDTTGYINNILTLDHKWGGHSDWGTVVTGAPQPQSGVAPPGGSSGSVPTGSTPWDGATGVVQTGQQYLGKPYVWGGASPATSFDCSGLVQYAYQQQGVSLPRTAQQQYDATQRISGDQLQQGDLVFFTNTYETNEAVTHVGIFAGYDQQGHPMMLNAATGGVLYAPFDSAYWADHLYGFGRVKK